MNPFKNFGPKAQQLLGDNKHWLSLVLIAVALFGGGMAVGRYTLPAKVVTTEKVHEVVKDRIVEVVKTEVKVVEVKIHDSKQAEKVLKITYLEAKLYKSDVIGTEHLLLSLLRDDDNIAAQILHQFNVHYDVVRNERAVRARALRRAVHSPLAGFQNAGAAQDVLFAGAFEERRLHVRRDPVLVSSSLRHDR